MADKEQNATETQQQTGQVLTEKVTEPEQIADKDEVDGVLFKSVDTLATETSLQDTTKSVELCARPASECDSSFLADSDDEDGEKKFVTSDLAISWLDLGEVLGNNAEKLAIGPLPGCRFKDNWRNLDKDIKFLQSHGIQDVFTLCRKGELYKYRVKNLIEEFEEADFIVHQFPVHDGEILDIKELVKLVEELKVLIMKGQKCFLHCFGGLGRCCFVAACLLMFCDSTIVPKTAIEKVRELRGPAAIQSVRQYNMVNEFPVKLKEFQTSNNSGSGESRTLSR